MIVYQGHPVSDGIIVGDLYLAEAPLAEAPQTDAPLARILPGDLPTTSDPHAPVITSGASAAIATHVTQVTADDVVAAFASVAEERTELATRLRAQGREHDAGIVTIGALIAADQALIAPVVESVGPSAVPVAVATAAVQDAAQAQAAILEALPDPDLAQRASDVRQVAIAVIARLAGTVAAPPPPAGRPFILIAREADPADLIRLADAGLAGVVSVGGGGSSHAAIIARGLGLPMLAGADPAVLSAPAGHLAILDASAGELTVDPSAGGSAGVAGGSAGVAGGVAGSAVDARAGEPTAAPRAVRTADGERVTLLCNVASAAETRLGLAGGAGGVGLLRTEIPFTQARGWPSGEEHFAALRPILGLLAGRTAVVRLLDFAGDKVPPFPGAEGLTAFLQAPRALADQLAAVLEAGPDAGLRVMIPMVRTPEEIRVVRAELARAAKAAGMTPPPLGIMVEVAQTAARAELFAAEVDFFSIGTNDLTADVLGRDRSELRPADTAAPAVLRLIGHVTTVAARAGIGVSVCGDSAADPAVLPLLIGLGVRTLSVGAARVPLVADWIGGVDATEAAARVEDL